MRAEAFSTFEDVKTRVLQATDIVALVGQSVRLKRRGKDFVGLCPFHQEKTPSFSVSPSKQRFYCYGCEKGGNAIDFVMFSDRVEFKDALRKLAESAGIDMPHLRQSKETVSERQVLLEAQSSAAMFFEKLLSHPERGAAARKYLVERGFDAESIKRFRIGLAADSWDALISSVSMKKFTPPQMALAGLAKARERQDGASGGFYDTFRNRLMFPIRDEGGRVIAFGGRVMPGSEDPAKYLNSPETPLFSKSRCIFGIDLARQKIVETRTAAVVEGYTDVVMAHQFGVSNVVSVLGTALTEHHVAILRRFADRIVLVFDGDRAGDAAANRAMELFLSQPVEIAIASLPDGMDPDEFLLKNGAEAFNKFLADATDALTYKWRQLVQQLKDKSGLTSRQKAVQDYLDTLAAARGSAAVDPIRWGAALARVSRLTETPMEELNQRFRIKTARKRPAVSATAQAAQVGEADQPKSNVSAIRLTARQRAEGFILGLLLSEPQRWHKIQQELKPSDFTDDSLRRIAELFWQHSQDEGEPVCNELLNLISDVELKSIAVRWANESGDAIEKDQYLADSLGHIMREREIEERKRLVVGLRQTAGPSGVNGPEAKQGDVSADIETLRKLQEKARHPDLMRVTL
jgi:DNA primase